MKALVLAAGLGTRLRPHTLCRPKPLFSIGGVSILESVIHKLAAAGCRDIAVNTHHLSRQIEDFVRDTPLPARVFIQQEANILGTGGAIKNLSDFWDDEPFLVVNGDIVFDIDLSTAAASHRHGIDAATLVLHDHAEFNTVCTNMDRQVLAFADDTCGSRPGNRLLAFTGIQVLDPLVLDFIPPHTFYSSIDAFRSMLAAGKRICAHVVSGHYWNDIGTEARYLETCRYVMSRQVLVKKGMGTQNADKIHTRPLAGDGSDRQWSRAKTDRGSVIIAGHGLRTEDTRCEIDAFVDIGRHLRHRQIPVPKIYSWDRFSGTVVMQDLGDTRFQTLVLNARDDSQRMQLYRRAVDLLIGFSRDGHREFDPSWTWQTATYDQKLIVEKECRYFLDAYVRDVAGLSPRFADYAYEFKQLANFAVAFSIEGLMHRDYQSRNIMSQGNALFVIDFQGARTGPLQYDLASLLNDPYTDLPFDLREALLAYAAERLADKSGRLAEGFRYCSLTRGLQVLGAFGFLAHTRGKHFFRQHIPAALRSLPYFFKHLPAHDFPRLRQLCFRLREIPDIATQGSERKGIRGKE